MKTIEELKTENERLQKLVSTLESRCDEAMQLLNSKKEPIIRAKKTYPSMGRNPTIRVEHTFKARDIIIPLERGDYLHYAEVNKDGNIIAKKVWVGLDVTVLVGTFTPTNQEIKVPAGTPIFSVKGATNLYFTTIPNEYAGQPATVIVPNQFKKLRGIPDNSAPTN
jgi:hypothetical protein